MCFGSEILINPFYFIPVYFEEFKRFFLSIILIKIMFLSWINSGWTWSLRKLN